MPKALFFDIDGTISNWRDDGVPYIPESAVKAIKATRAKGNLCFLATGRSMPEITDDYLDIGFDGYVSGAGNCLIYHDEVILSTKLSGDSVREILSVLEENDASYSVEGDKGIYISEKLLKHIKETGDYGFMNICRHIYPDIHYDDVNKICFDAGIRNFEAIKEKLAERYSFFNSSYVENNTASGEISLKNVSKGSTITWLLDYLKIAKEDSFAFGDADNDIEMLKVCGSAVAMGRHSKNLEAYADFITRNVEDDGLEYAMKHYGLI